jgi:hypothetical protein
MITALKRILLAEDDANDVEPTLTALGENRLANEVVVVNDGSDVLDYLRSRGRFAERAPGNPAREFIDAVKSLGLFWAVVNQPPPGILRKTA